jgi:hypothetical protein
MKSDAAYDNWAMNIQLAVERITCQNFIGSERPVVGDVGDRVITCEVTVDLDKLMLLQETVETDHVAARTAAEYCLSRSI